MKFKRIYVEITNVCNMTCSFCPDSLRDKQFITVENFEKIAKKVKINTDYIYLHIKGEPLLHPNILEILDLAKENDLKVNLTTNGTILNESILEKEALRQINFSLHSFEEGDNKKKLEYLNSIFSFTKKAQKNRIISSLRLWNIEKDSLTEENKETVAIISDFYKKEILFSEFLRGKGVKVEENIYLNFEEVFQWPDISNAYAGERGYCQGLNTHIGILVDGTVVPCCLDHKGIIELGNIYNSEKLEDILSNVRAKKIIEGFKNRMCTETLCKHCSFKNRF